jgi:hypothetical protein
VVWILGIVAVTVTVAVQVDGWRRVLAIALLVIAGIAGPPVSRLRSAARIIGLVLVVLMLAAALLVCLGQKQTTWLIEVLAELGSVASAADFFRTLLATALAFVGAFLLVRRQLNHDRELAAAESRRAAAVELAQVFGNLHFEMFNAADSNEVGHVVQRALRAIEHAEQRFDVPPSIVARVDELYERYQIYEPLVRESKLNRIAAWLIAIAGCGKVLRELGEVVQPLTRWSGFGAPPAAQSDPLTREDHPMPARVLGVGGDYDQWDQDWDRWDDSVRASFLKEEERHMEFLAKYPEDTRSASPRERHTRRAHTIAVRVDNPPRRRQRST